jgi:hypothetical protein
METEFRPQQRAQQRQYDDRVRGEYQYKADQAPSGSSWICASSCGPARDADENDAGGSSYGSYSSCFEMISGYFCCCFEYICDLLKSCLPEGSESRQLRADIQQVSAFIDTWGRQPTDSIQEFPGALGGQSLGDRYADAFMNLPHTARIRAETHFRQHYGQEIQPAQTRNEEWQDQEEASAFRAVLKNHVYDDIITQSLNLWRHERGYRAPTRNEEPARESVRNREQQQQSRQERVRD